MNLSGKLNAAHNPAAKLTRSPAGLLIPINPRGSWLITARDPDGNIIDQREWENVVTTAGENYLLDAGLDNQTQIGTWYILLTDGTPTVNAADTLASHAGWAEVSAYTGNRVQWVGGAAAAGSIDNSGTPASFSINADATTIGGAGMCSVATGTAGTLYSVGAFSGGDLVLNNGSTLDVTATFTV